jgi:hemoglobin/transferrin/lactoferrin receptor protein
MKSIFTICLVMCFYLVQAQHEEDSTTWTHYLNEVIVSANRWEQSLIEVPNKVTTISADLVKFQNPQTAADLLSTSHHVFIQKSQLGGGSPMIRGFATNRVLLVVDGVRMNNAIFRSGNVQNVISLDANAIDEAEVIFGPGSVIYGSDAIGGVMDFHTLKPAFSENGKTFFKSNVLTRYASANNEMTGHVDVNIGLKNWAFVSSLTHSDYGDLTMGSNGPEAYTRPDYVVRQDGEDVVLQNSNPDEQVQSGYDQWNAMQKISFRSRVWTASYGFHFSRTSNYPRYDRLILKNSSGDFSNAEWYYGPQQWMMHALRFDLNKPSAWQDHSRIVVAYQDFEESRHTRSFGGGRKTNRWENVKAFSVNLDMDKELNETLTMYYGAEYIGNEVGSTASRVDVNTGEVTPASTRYPDDSEWRTYAAYLSLKIKPSRNWVINVSNRFTNVFSSATFDRSFFDFPFEQTTLRSRALNGSAGVVYSPSSLWKVYSNVSTGFRAPNIDDIGKVFDSQPGNVVVPNPGLEPERAYNVEAGFAGYAGNRLKVDMSVYYTLVDNAIARAAGTFNGQDSIEYDGVLSRVLSLQNISEIRVGGIQAGFDLLITEGLRMTSAINFQRGTEQDPATGKDFTPAHVAPLFGATHLIYSRDKMKLDLYGIYNGTKPYKELPIGESGDNHLYAPDDDGNPYSPSWATVNFKGSYNVNRYLTVNAGIENILDKRYRPYASGISAPGRNFILALRGTF